MKADGRRCSAPAQAGAKHCFFHNPATQEARRAASSAGGSRPKLRVLSTDSPDASVTDVEGVVNLLSETISQVRRGELDPRIGNALGYLAGIALRALEMRQAGRLPQEVETGSNLDIPLPATEELLRGLSLASK